MKHDSIWKVLYKVNGEDNYQELKGVKDYWYADPLLFHYLGETYLFTEAFYMPLQIGQLAVSKFEHEAFTVPEVIIKTSYHKSYPCVFEYKDKVYMIPETGQNGTLELWEAQDSLFDWKKKGDILEGVVLADTTVLIQHDEIYLFSYAEVKPYKTHIYKLDVEKLSAVEIQCFVTEENRKRPAGYFFEKNGVLFRPVQNNTKRYGESMIVNEVVSLEPFKEIEKYEIKPSEFSVDANKYTNTHTLSFDDKLTVVDVAEAVELPLKNRLYIIRKVRNKLYKIRNLFKWRKKS